MAKRAKFLNDGDTIGLIPMTSIQMLDIGINKSGLRAANRNRPYYRAVSKGVNGVADIDISIIELDKNTKKWFDTSAPGPMDDSEVKKIQAENSITFKKIVEAFAGKWLPLPYFKRENTEKLAFKEEEIGPTNWVRGRLIKTDNEDEPYHLVLAVDTWIFVPSSQETSSQQRKYLMPTDMDIQTGGTKKPNTFSLCGEKQLLDYVKEDWVQQWIDNCYIQHCANSRRKSNFTNESERLIKGRMLYLTLIQYLCKKLDEDGAESAGIAPDIYLVQTGDMRTAESIKVDLVLDIGHSRTCGFLLDNMENSNDFKGAPLELRDLSQPDMVDNQVFESRLEFAIADFGDKQLSRDSGRRFPPAFHWPSICRVGSEARRMSCQSGSQFGKTGFINPKRYLWDKVPRPYAWRFSSSESDEQDIIGNKDSMFCNNLDASGNYDKASRNLQAKYPRSAMTLFFLGEIINQVISQINSAGYRLKKGRSDVPRVLRSIMLTVPSAFSAEEIESLEQRAKDAVKIIWKLLGWGDNDPRLKQFIHGEPEVLVQWDEATCTQATYLYAEIAHKFHGRDDTFLKLLGKSRQFPDHHKKTSEIDSIRIASLDIGGGSTDLSITTFGQPPGGGPLKAQFNFREGFSFAGNQVLKAVIEKVVLPGLIYCLEKDNIPDVEREMRRLFQSNVVGQTELERLGRNAFGKQICQPVALHALTLHEQDPDMDEGKLCILRLRDILKEEKYLSETALNYLNPIFNDGDTNTEEEESKLLNLRIPLDMEALISAVEGALQQTIAQLCEVIFQYQADVLLVSGGLSRFPVVQKLLSNRMPVDLGRIEFMHGYRAGSWYPYRDAEDVINEPKTTVVIGAAILNRARGNLTNFSLMPEEFRFGTMVRHIGFMDNNNTINKTLFRAPFKQSQEVAVTISEEKPIGFQQFQLKRWPVSPFYYISFKDADTAKKFSAGIKVTLSIEAVEDEAEGETNVPMGYKLNIEGSSSKPVNEDIDFDQQEISNAVVLSPCSVIRDIEEKESCFKFTSAPELAEKVEQLTVKQDQLELKESNL